MNATGSGLDDPPAGKPLKLSDQMAQVVGCGEYLSSDSDLLTKQALLAVLHQSDHCVPVNAFVVSVLCADGSTHKFMLDEKDSSVKRLKRLIQVHLGHNYYAQRLFKVPANFSGPMWPTLKFTGTCTVSLVVEPLEFEWQMLSLYDASNSLAIPPFVEFETARSIWVSSTYRDEKDRPVKFVRQLADPTASSSWIPVSAVVIRITASHANLTCPSLMQRRHSKWLGLLLWGGKTAIRAARLKFTLSRPPSTSTTLMKRTTM